MGWARVMSLSSLHVSAIHRGVCLQVLGVTLSIQYPKLSFLVHKPLSLCSAVSSPLLSGRASRSEDLPNSIEMSKLMAGEEDSRPKELL